MLWWPDGLETAPRKAITLPFFQVFARFLYVNAFPDSQICVYAPGKRAGRYAGRSPRFSLSYISYNSGIFAIMSNGHLVAVPILHMSGPSQAHRDCWHWQAIGPPPSLRRILRTGTARAGGPRDDAPHGASTSPSRLCAILDPLANEAANPHAGLSILL